MDEALGLAIGFRRIGPGSDVLETEPLAGSAEGARFVARSVVGAFPSRRNDGVEIVNVFRSMH